MVRQHTFDAYGQLLYAEDLAAAPWSRVGHQGLFFDRLDAPQGSRDLTPRHAPTATPGAYTLAQIDGLYQNRNRTYAPTLGRWLQADPNGTGSPVLDSMEFQGHGIDVILPSPAASSILTDGLNQHISYGGNPVPTTDPSGLFSLGGMMSGVGIAAGMAASYVLPGPSSFITGMYGSLMATYSAGLSWDVDWASDWNMPDDMHTRTDDSWVAMALGQGLYNALGTTAFRPVAYTIRSAETSALHAQWLTSHMKFGWWLTRLVINQ